MAAYATEKQQRFILSLARKAGLSTTWMDSTWKPYATMRQRSGKVVDFVENLNMAEASNLIAALKSTLEERGQ